MSVVIVCCQLSINMRRTLKFILWITILLFGAGLYSMNTDFLAYEMSLPDTEQPVVPDDTVPKVRTRFPVAKTVPEEYQDLTKQSPADLKTPDNVKSVVEYDIRTGTYVVRTKLGDADLTTPISLTPEEYQDYSFQKSVQSYYRQKNEEEFQKAANKQFNLADMQFNIGAAERIFGPGGVRVKTQGSAEVELGLKQNKTKNPSLPERARNRTFFNFDENVQLNVQASVGSKVNFDMNYNTETSFDFDSKKLKLAYTGEEDEIIKALQIESPDNDALLQRLGSLAEKADNYCVEASEENQESFVEVNGNLYQKVWNEAAAMREHGEFIRIAPMIRCPMVIIHGANDTTPMEGVVEPIKDLVKDFKYFKIEKSGHSPWKEKYGKELFFQIVFSECKSSS